MFSWWLTLRTPWWNCYRTATASELLWTRRNVTGGAFQTDTNLANHRHRTRLLADCQWRCRWRCGLGRLRNTRSLTKTIPRDRRKLIKLMLRKWTFLPPRSHLIRQFVKRHLVTLRREQYVLAQWLRQYFCQDHGVRSVLMTLLIWMPAIGLLVTYFASYTVRLFCSAPLTPASVSVSKLSIGPLVYSIK